jgi:hypothetical protein
MALQMLRIAAIGMQAAVMTKISMVRALAVTARH